MPRSRGLEMPQKQSPRAPLHLKTTACSEANSTHRSPRLDDRRSPRSSPLHEVPVCSTCPKKRGTRVVDLETKLGLAQEELKKLKEQLASAEAAKRDAQQELEETKKLVPVVNVASGEVPEEQEEEGGEDPLPLDLEEKTQVTQPPPIEEELLEPELVSDHGEENAICDAAATHVFEVAVATDGIPTDIPTRALLEQGEDEGKNDNAVVEGSAKKEEVEPKALMIEEEAEPKGLMIEEELELNALTIEEEEYMIVEAPENPEVTELRGKLVEKDKQLESLNAENEILKKQEAAAAAEAKVKEEELSLKVCCMESMLRESNAKAERLIEQLGAVEKAKGTLETEMRRLRVQTSQWRKAAETAAAVLTAEGDVGANGRRVAERCSYEMGGGGFVGLGSPMMSEEEEGLGGGKRRGASMRMFGDLWKKKGQQK